MYACNGILLNHESPRRGEPLFTQKITRGLANTAQGLEECLHVGNLNALRYWDHANDYLRMQWLMLKQDKAEDFVIGAGAQYSVRQFIEWSTKELGFTLRFEDKAFEERAVVTRVNTDIAPRPTVKRRPVVVRIDTRYFQPAESKHYRGIRRKQRRNWGGYLESPQMKCAKQ